MWQISPDSHYDRFDVFENEQVRNKNEEANNDDFFDDFFNFEED